MAQKKKKAKNQKKHYEQNKKPGKTKIGVTQIIIIIFTAVMIITMVFGTLVQALF